MKILVINGPNLNMLGIREKHIYGDGNYHDLINFVSDVCAKEGIEPSFFQSNHEGAIVDEIQKAYGQFDGIIINPAAYTHTSIAILDAIKAVGMPTVEVHLSDVNAREDFRKISFVRAACIDTFSGMGFEGYKMAVLRLKEYC